MRLSWSPVRDINMSRGSVYIYRGAATLRWQYTVSQWLSLFPSLVSLSCTNLLEDDLIIRELHSPRWAPRRHYHVFIHFPVYVTCHIWVSCILQYVSGNLFTKFYYFSESAARRDAAAWMLSSVRAVAQTVISESYEGQSHQIRLLRDNRPVVGQRGRLSLAVQLAARLLEEPERQITLSLFKKGLKEGAQT